MSRVRIREFGPTPITERWTVPGNPTELKTGSYGGGYWKVTDELHDLSSLGHGDCGGPLIIEKDRITVKPGATLTGFGAGSDVVIRPSYWAGMPDEPYNSTLWAYGGTAIARTLPTNPVVDLGTSFAESLNYRQALPKAIGASLFKEKLAFLKSLGHEYLNLEFGWKPLLRDILDVCKVVVKSDQYIQELKNGSGRKTRKGFHFPDVTESLNAAPAFYYSVDSAHSGWDAGPIQYNGLTQTKRWFKGCYTYTVPFANSTISNSEHFRVQAEYLLGLRPTLEQVWNASPWSWMVDWAVNVGDVARNISAFGRDSLFLQYGYIMQHTLVDEKYWAMGGPPDGGPCLVTYLDTRRTSEWKVRYPADPYGFGITYDGLSDAQKLILASVGITHF